MKPSTKWVRMTVFVASGFSWFSGTVVELDKGEGLGFCPSRGVKGEGEPLGTRGSSDGGGTTEDWMGDRSDERLETAANPGERTALRTRQQRAFTLVRKSKHASA